MVNEEANKGLIDNEPFILTQSNRKEKRLSKTRRSTLAPHPKYEDEEEEPRSKIGRAPSKIGR